MDWFITETKGSPVNNKEVFGPEFSKGTHCFLRVHVTGSHKPSWFIGTEVENCQVNGKFCSDFAESLKISCVPGNEDSRSAGSLDQE